MTASERGYLSIGEVLALLQEEFPDVTISKIRFLESQGLIEPERTPSGYRKFYGLDVERLRFILREQRENYLPLRVIRDRLDAGPSDDGTVEVSVATIDLVTVAFEGLADHDEVTPPGGASDVAPHEATSNDTTASDGTEQTHAVAADAAVVAAPVEAAPVAAAPVAEPAAAHVPVWMRKAPPGVVRASERERTTHPSSGPTASPAPLHLVPAVAEAAPAAPATTAAALAAVDPQVQLTLDELAAAAGVDVAVVRDLERYGLIAARAVGRDAYYGADAVQAATLARVFLRHGIEARHLRMYKQAAERETALFEQVVAPLVKQRNPKARAQAADAVRELAEHGAALRALLVSQALRELQP